MIKRILYTVLPILGLIFAVYAWYTIDQRIKNTVEVQDFFDEEALLYGSIHDVGDLIRGVERSYAPLFDKLPFEDPVLDAFKNWKEIGAIDEWNHTISRLNLHFVVYLDSGDVLFAWVVKYEGDRDRFVHSLINGFSNVGKNTLKYDAGSQIISSADRNIYTKKVERFILISKSQELLNQLESNVEKKSDLQFSNLSEHAGLNLQINQKQWEKWLLTDSNGMSYKNSWKEKWMAFEYVDVHFKKRTLFASSLTHNNDWVNLANELSPTSKEQLKLIPQGSSFFAWMNFKNEGYYRAYNAVFDEPNNIKNFDYLKWIDGEVTFFESDSAYFMMVSSKFSEYDPELVLEDINVQHTERQIDSIEYQDYSSYRLMKFYASDAFGKFVPSYLKGNRQYTWYTSMGDQIVFCSSKDGLENFIDHFTAQKFLLSDEVIENNINPHHGHKSSFLVYDDLSEAGGGVLSGWYADNFSTGEYKFYWSLNSTSVNDVLHHLSWSDYSLQKSEDMVSDDNGIVWEKELDYSPTGNYITFYDPKNGNVMLIEGDDEHLHYIKSNGEEIKRVKLTGALVGNPQFISANKGREKYLMYNTSKSVYLSDLQGGIHSGFPFESKVKISGTARIFDYENDGKLRIIVPLSNGDVQNINKNGKIVEGWIMKKVDESFVSYPRHFIREGKDYMCFFTSSKKLYAVDRRGELRPGFPLDFNGWTGGDVKLSVANTIKDSYIRYISREGKLKRVYFTGEKDAVDLVHETRHYTWDFEDLTGDGNSEFIATREGYITVYNDVGIEIYSYPVNVIDLHALQVIEKEKGESYLGYILKDKEQLILLDAFGELKKGYPLEATNLFLTMDVKGDNQRELVFFNKNKLICTENW